MKEPSHNNWTKRELPRADSYAKSKGQQLRKKLFCIVIIISENWDVISVSNMPDAELEERTIGGWFLDRENSYNDHIIKEVRPGQKKKITCCFLFTN